MGVIFIIKQKQERNINMTDCVSITIDNDVEQTLRILACVFIFVQ